MPTSTVEENREREEVACPPTLPAEAPTPQWLPDPQLPVRRRRRRSRGRSALRWSLRIVAILLIAFLLVLLLQGTAYSDTADSSARKAQRPSSIQEWVEQLAREKALRGQEKSEATSESPKPVGSKSDESKTEDSPKPDASEPEAKTQSKLPAEPPAGPKAQVPQVQPPKPKPIVEEPVRPTVVRPTKSPRPETPVDVEPIDFAGKVRPLSEVPIDELPWTETLRLILSLEKEFADHAPLVNLGALRREIYDHLITLSVTLGHNDNPRENLDELRAYLEKVLSLNATEQSEPRLERLLPRSVLVERRGSPVAVALIALVLSDLVSKYLELEPVMAGDQIGLRYRSGMHRYTLIPTTLDRLYSDRDFLRWATGQSEPNEQKIRVLTRREFWGMVMAEAGAALLTEDHTARAASMLSRSIDLFPDQALPHIATARILLSRNDLESARDELNLAVKLEPGNTMARFDRASILETIGEFDTLEEDLRWLTHKAKSPLAAVRLIRYYLDRSLFRDAEREYRALAKQSLPPSMKKELVELELAVHAAPWIARLLHSSSDADRFEAIDSLAKYPTQQALKALIATLDDDNMRLGNYAYKALRELSHMDLPKDSARWTRAFERLPRD